MPLNRLSQPYMEAGIVLGETSNSVLEGVGSSRFCFQHTASLAPSEMKQIPIAPRFIGKGELQRAVPLTSESTGERNCGSQLSESDPRQTKIGPATQPLCKSYRKPPENSHWPCLLKILQTVSNLKESLLCALYPEKKYISPQKICGPVSHECPISCKQTHQSPASSSPFCHQIGLPVTHFSLQLHEFGFLSIFQPQFPLSSI